MSAWRSMTMCAVLAGLTAAFAVPADAAEYVVRMRANATTGKLIYAPARLTIKPGDTVVWVNDDDVNPHNIVAYANGIPEGTEMFESPMLEKKGQRWSMTFTKEGSYGYHCHPHEEQGMRGTIVVGRESRPDEMRKTKAGEEAHQHGPGHKH